LVVLSVKAAPSQTGLLLVIVGDGGKAFILIFIAALGLSQEFAVLVWLT